MGDKDDYRMAIFSGRLEDWDTWKSEVESFIGAKDPDKADIIVGITKSPISGDEAKPYDEKNAKGYFILKKYLKGAAASLIEKFRQDKNGAGAFRALRDKYELKGETQKALLMSEFSHLNFNENGDPGETFEAAEELARKMKSRFDMEINDSILLTHLINKIPSAYGMVKVSLETQDLMSYSNLKSKMINHFVTNIANKVKDDQCLAVSFNGYCNWCGKYGHKEIECLVKKNGGGRAGPPNNGNKLGRYERIPGNPYNGAGKGGRISYGRGKGGRGGRSGRGRGKGLHGGNGCRYCGSADHWGNECPKNKTEHSYTCLLATKNISGALDHTQSTPVMVDSGATSHTKRDTEGLINVRQHSGHVYVENGEKLEVCYIEDWLMEVKHSDGTVKDVMFKDVIVVPNLSRDLLSMAKIDKAGGKIVIREGKGTIQKGDTCLPMRKVGNMYLLDYYGKKCEEANVVSSPELWH
jgi:hypothetical protein